MPKYPPVALTSEPNITIGDINDINGTIYDKGHTNPYWVALVNTTGSTISPATEGTLDGIKTQTDKLTFDPYNNLNVNLSATSITLPVDIQSVYPISQELYGADETTAQSVELAVDGYSLIEVNAEATAPTTFTIEYSYDNTHWFTYYQSKFPETKLNRLIRTACRYIKLSSSASGTTGDTVTLIIGAKP